MSPVEKWSTFAATADFYARLFTSLSGIAVLAAQKKFTESAPSRVSRGEISETDAKKGLVLLLRYGFVVAGCGVLQIVIWSIARCNS
jgi:hypothetical protein